MIDIGFVYLVMFECYVFVDIKFDGGWNGLIYCMFDVDFVCVLFCFFVLVIGVYILSVEDVLVVLVILVGV